MCIDKQELEKAIKISKSTTDVIRLFGKPVNGFYTKTFNRLISEGGYDTSHFSKNKKYVSLVCSCCGETFEIEERLSKNRLYCSIQCSNQKPRSKQKEWSELKGRKSYIKICFRYHEKKCVVCGEENIVTVHHYDGNHENNDPRNLIPICPTHHSYMHSKYKKLVCEKVENYHAEFNGDIVSVGST